MADQDPPILRPVPRRPFELSQQSPDNSYPPTPSSPTSPQLHSSSWESLAAKLRNAQASHEDSLHANGANGSKKDSSAPSRSRSILNLTSSTLFGIYQPTGYDGQSGEASTPWGTGAETPARSGSMDISSSSGIDRFYTAPLKKPTTIHTRPTTLKRTNSRPGGPMSRGIFPAMGRITALFVFGLLYGELVSHLHENQNIAPVRVEGIDRASWVYLVFWGVAGVGLGSLLPWVDGFWEGDGMGEGEGVGMGGRERSKSPEPGSPREGEGDGDTGVGAEWNPVVRSVGAFVGIAFAIRKLPWQSTLQLSLTLALANPVLWYLLDRTLPGFLLSAVVGLSGTALLLTVNPDLVPPPATLTHALHSVNATTSHTAVNGYDTALLGGFISQESVGVATWIASVLFCSCVCFGAVGRRLGTVRR